MTFLFRGETPTVANISTDQKIRSFPLERGRRQGDKVPGKARLGSASVGEKSGRERETGTSSAVWKSIIIVKEEWNALEDF